MVTDEAHMGMSQMRGNQSPSQEQSIPEAVYFRIKKFLSLYSLYIPV